MAVIALQYIKTGAGVTAPGETITGLEPAEERRLVYLGAASFVDVPTRGHDTSHALNVEETGEDEDDALIIEALMALTKAQMVAYGKAIGVVVDSDATKHDIAVVLSAQDVVLEELPKPALNVLAKADGIDTAMSREELIQALSEED